MLVLLNPFQPKACSLYFLLQSRHSNHAQASLLSQNHLLMNVKTQKQFFEKDNPPRGKYNKGNVEVICSAFFP